jgi:hypothetical protein
MVVWYDQRGSSTFFIVQHFGISCICLLAKAPNLKLLRSVKMKSQVKSGMLRLGHGKGKDALVTLCAKRTRVI